MKNNLMTDMLRLALSKKKFSQRFFYLLKGIIFTPAIIIENKKRINNEKNRSDASLACDDVYPLF